MTTLISGDVLVVDSANNAVKEILAAAGIPPSNRWTAASQPHLWRCAAFTVSATSNSTGALTYTVVSGPATICGATVTLTGEIIATVRIILKLLRFVVVTLWLTAGGCWAQVGRPVGEVNGALPQVGMKLPAEIARRVEVMIRNKSQVPQDYTVSIGVPTTSTTQGFDQIVVTGGPSGQPGVATTFLISADGKTLAQMKKFDIGEDPRQTVSSAGRPARGGDENAPVLIVGFDDLECPFCAKMNALLFPAVLDRYKNLVRVVYRDFPLSDIHPWAMHAAVDANCLGAASADGYWKFVDYVHAHADEMSGADHTVARAYETLDKLTLEEGKRSRVDAAALRTCVEKQDDTKVKASEKEAEANPLSVDSTPILFINGEKVDGTLPIGSLYAVIDRALIAAGQTPPPQSFLSEPQGTPVAAEPAR